MGEVRVVDSDVCRDYLIEGRIRRIGALTSRLYGYKVGDPADVQAAWTEAWKFAEEDMVAKAVAMGGSIVNHYDTVAVKNELEGFLMMKAAVYEEIEPEN
jgi:hypothetical protein